MAELESSECPACVVQRFWLETLGFCGCGRQGSTLGIFRDVMQTMHDASINGQADWNAQCHKREAIFGENEAWKYLVYYVLDAHGITEHGGSVPGWLTEEGERVLAAMSGKSDIELAAMLKHEHEESADVGR